MMSDQSLSTIDITSFDVSNASNAPSPFMGSLLERDSLFPGPYADILLKLIPVRTEAEISLEMTRKYFRDISSWITESITKQLIEQQSATFSFIKATEKAISGYQSGLLSLGRAAEIAGLPYDSMIKQLKLHGIRLKFGPSSPEEAEEEQLIFWRRVRRQQDSTRG